MKKNCLIYNYAQHYRLGIFKLLDNELNFDSYFGDKMQDVKQLDYSELSNFKNELKNLNIISPIYWQLGVLRLIFKNYKNYILLGEYYCLSTWVFLILGKFTNKKFFLWSHGWYGNEGFLKKTIKKIFFNLGDGVLLYGNYAKHLMIKEGFKSDKLHVIYNSLNYEEQLNVRNKLKASRIYTDYFKNENPTIIFIGRLTKIKKLEQIIAAKQLLDSQNKFINIVFIGDGEEKEQLKNFVSKNALNNIWFYGASYNETEIGNLIFNADICVSPGNVGLTAMHALVYGTPVITNDDFSSQMPEFEAVEKGVTGDFFEKNNLNSLSNTIENWLLHHKNRKFIRNKCFERIDTYFNPGFQIKIIKDVLNEE
jgi:glycosyltransferase involved in cell wall biosynthesis